MRKIGAYTPIIRKLLAEAKSAIIRSHSPFSGFKVGAAVFGDKSGENYRSFSYGNIESNCSQCGVCAERLAMCVCMAEGYKPSFLGIVGNSVDYVFPCGVCAQFLLDYPTLSIYVGNFELTHAYSFQTPDELLPYAFKRKPKFA